MDLLVDHKRYHNPSVFSRADLELTITLLRPIAPSLALAVRNITMQSPVDKPTGTAPQRTDQFRVTLDYQDVTKVVETLTELNLNLASYESTKAKTIIRIRTLIFIWLDLAKTFLSKQQRIPDHAMGHSTVIRIR